MIPSLVLDVLPVFLFCAFHELNLILARRCMAKFRKFYNTHPGVGLINLSAGLAEACKRLCIDQFPSCKGSVRVANLGIGLDCAWMRPSVRRIRRELQF